MNLLPLNPVCSHASRSILLAALAGSFTSHIVAQTAPSVVTNPSSSQPAASTAPTSNPALPRIRGFSINGNNPLTDAEVTVVLASFLRAEANLDNLQKAAAALEQAMREKGFGLHRVLLPPQELGENITLNLAQFTIGQVTVEGETAFSKDNIRQGLPELKPGGTPNLDRLATQTALVNENPTKHVQVALRAATQPDQIDATIKVQDSKPLKFAAVLSNTGSASSGRDRFTVSADHSNLFDRDHQLSAAYTTSLARPGDVHQYGLTYRIPLYNQLGMVDMSFTKSDVLGNFGTFNSTGAGRTLGIGYTHYLLPINGLNRFVTAGLEDKVFDPTAINGTPLVGQLQRRSRPLTLGLSARRQTDAGYMDGNVSLSVNLPGGAGNNLAAYQSESPLVTSARWAALRARGNWAFPVGDSGWVASWRGQAQWAPKSLIAGEQFGLGGFGSIRGASERAVSGDSGISSTVEMRSPEWFQGLRLVGFVDAGWLSHRNTGGGITPSSDSVASLGVGLRYNKGPMALVLDYGRIVKSSAVPLSLNSASPQHGDHKVHLSLSARF